MTFETWLRKQNKRDDSTGDLSKDFICTKERTIMKSFKKFHPTDEALIAFDRAVKEWKRYVVKQGE